MTVTAKKMTQPARDYVEEVYVIQGREVVVDILENQLGRACYDHEDLEDELIPAVIIGIEAGDIKFDFSKEACNSHGHMLWMDHSKIDQVWED